MSVKALAGLIGERERQVIHAVVDQVMSQPSQELAFRLMPIKDVPDSILIHEKVAGFGGLTQERVKGEEGKAVSAGSSAMKYFDPGAYQEHIPFFERELLRLRKYGTIGDRGLTGMTDGQLDELTRAGMKLKKRINNRMQKLIWDAIFNGSWSYQGVNYSFDVPGGNALTAATDWNDPTNSTPAKDLWTLIKTNPILIKYLFEEIIINPVTEAAFLNSNDTKAFIQNYNIPQNDINVIAQFLRPGLPKITVCRDSWQDESYAADGSVALGNAQYFVPDNKALLVPKLSGTLFPYFGEMQIAENLNDPSATVASPAQGVYVFVDEEGLKHRKAPRIDVVAGFNGAPNLMRGDDVFVVSV